LFDADTPLDFYLRPTYCSLCNSGVIDRHRTIVRHKLFTRRTMRPDEAGSDEAGFQRLKKKNDLRKERKKRRFTITEAVFLGPFLSLSPSIDFVDRDSTVERREKSRSGTRNASRTIEFTRDVSLIHRFILRCIFFRWSIFLEDFILLALIQFHFSAMLAEISRGIPSESFPIQSPILPRRFSFRSQQTTSEMGKFVSPFIY